MSHHWLAKAGDVQGRNNEGDRSTRLDLNLLTRRFERAQLTGPAARNTTSTLTAAELMDGIVTSAPAAAVTLTTPTATLLATLDHDSAVGRGYEFVVINTDGMNTVTLAAGVNVTLVGSAAVAPATSARFQVVYTNVTDGEEAATVYRV